MEHVHVEHPGETSPWYLEHPRSRLSYRAIVAGVLSALVSQVVLMVLGAAIGLTAIAGADGAQREIGIGFLVWLLISLAISAFIGAYVAAASARTPLRRDGMLHGFVTWAAVSLVGLFLIGGTLFRLVGGAFGFATAPAPAGGPAAQIQERVSGEAQQVREGLQQPGQAQQTAEQATTGTAIGMWGLLAAHLVPLLTALLGGFVGARTEARALGLHDEDLYAHRRRPITTTTPTVPQPT